MLYKAVEQAPSAEQVEETVITRHFAKFDEQFFTFCDQELAKINTFYSGMLSALIFPETVAKSCGAITDKKRKKEKLFYII